MANHLISWSGTLAACLSSFLFLIRAHAVFYESRRAKIVLSILWALGCLGALSAPFSFKEGHIGKTQICTMLGVDKIGAAGAVAVGVFDTVIFVASYYRVVILTLGSNLRERVRGVIEGAEIGQVAKAIMQTGQLYYLYVFLLPYL